MSKEWFESLDKRDLLKNPENYPWNAVLYYLQFSQEELLVVKEHLDIPALVKYQTAATYEFLRRHFSKEIDNCLEVDWADVTRNSGQ